MYGNHLDNQFIYLSCAPSCDYFNGATCCASDNCNTVDLDIACDSFPSTYSCYVGGSFALTDSASSSFYPKSCPSLSDSYCGVVYFFNFRIS